MASSPPTRSPYLIPVIALFIVGLLLFLGMLIRYAFSQSPSPTTTSLAQILTYTSVSSESPSATSTITLTPRPTWTLRPSDTPTLTPTPTSTSTATLIPTLTPATPAKVNISYELKPWDLAEQERAVELMIANANLNPSDKAFRALAYAEGEGILRFPGTDNATRWRWDRAYNLVRIRDPQGIVLYSDLLRGAIKAGQVRASDLPTWFSQYETRFALQISPLPAQPGELSRELVEIIGQGSAYLWLVEIPGETNIYPLINDIDFNQPHENAFTYGDLTGDATPEVVIYRQNTPGATQFFSPHIFDLSATPPAELPIQTQAPIDFWLEPGENAEIITTPSNPNSLKMTSAIMPACPLFAYQEYSWDGSRFAVTPLHYEAKPIPSTAGFCQVVFDEAASAWGPDPAIIIANAMLPIWPPETDANGNPYPLDALDQLRYRLAIEYALANQPSDAVAYMSEIIDAPSTPDSGWVEPAQDFLHVYQAPHDLFIACQAAQFCNLRDAFKTLVLLSQAKDYSQALSYLQIYGVTIRSSGVMDFNQDGLGERWIIIQPKPGEKLEFWILYTANAQIQAAFVKVLEAGESLPFFHTPAGTIPVFQFELHLGYVFIILADQNLAYVQPVDIEYARPTVIKDGYQQALNDLMASEDVQVVLSTLLGLFNSPRFAGDCIAFNICDQFHYTLALAYDLASDSGDAIDQYLWVWRNYGASPYSIMARLKLNYFPLPTYTRTPIPTSTTAPTRTSTRTPTPSNTPTTTFTPTMTFTSTMTPSATPTPSVTPSPTSG